jgi:Spb1 C-terminal domain
MDAAYNRFSWNDPKDLPDWFTDDEAKHYRPQVYSKAVPTCIHYTVSII